jgi:hypothetical protein
MVGLNVRSGGWQADDPRPPAAACLPRFNRVDGTP